MSGFPPHAVAAANLCAGLHDQHVAVDFQPHVLEQAQCEQGPDRRRALFVVVLVAHPERQRAEHGARFHALQPLDALVDWVENGVTPDISKIQFYGSGAFQFSPRYSKL